MLAKETERTEPRVRTPRRAREPQRTRLGRTSDGQLVVVIGGVETPARVCPCFPWSQPLLFVSLRDYDDEEIGFVPNPAELDPASRRALEQGLAEAGFVLEIVRIDSIEEEIEIRAWHVQTRQGPRSFQTARDEWPRELPGSGLLVSDVAGDLFYVPDPSKLDSGSRDLLWAYAD